MTFSFTLRCLFRLLPTFVLVSIGSAATAQPEEATTPPGLVFGAMTHFAHGWKTDLVPRLTATGVYDVRDELYWDAVEPQPGVFAFPAAYDAYMEGLRSAGITPLIELDFENHNYDQGLTPYTDAGIAAYARYAIAILQHYGAQIGAVEIWNEYNGTWCRGPATEDRAASYTKMLTAAYTAIKRERPDVTVVGGATAGLPLPYLERLFADGALRSMDAVSIHPYRTGSPPEGLEIQVAALQKLIARYNAGRPLPIWVTEIGWGTHAAAAPGDLAIDESTQAKYLVRALVLLASAGVERTYWYLARDDRTTPTMGLLKNDADYTAKPVARAMATLQKELHGATFAQRETGGDGVYSMLFHRETGGDVRVLWSLSPFAMAIPEPTRVVDLNGTSIAPAGGGSISIGDSPVFMSGPLPALPTSTRPASANVVADSLADFSAQQEHNGWSYGAYIGDRTVFHPLAKYRVTNWVEEWTDAYPYISISEDRQHPSKSGTTPIAAVRRWKCGFDGTVHLKGTLKCGTRGDGVRVRVLIDGTKVYEASLGGGRTIAGVFDLEHAVQRGTTVDFAVDPGPAANIDYDSTAVSAVIERIEP